MKVTDSDMPGHVPHASGDEPQADPQNVGLLMLFPARAGMSRRRGFRLPCDPDAPRASGDESEGRSVRAVSFCVLRSSGDEPKWDDKMKDMNECSL